MAAYEPIINDLYGSMINKTGEVVTVPFLLFKDKYTKNHVRIPAEIYNDCVVQGMKQNEILQKKGQWYSMVRDRIKKDQVAWRKKQIGIHCLYDLIAYMETTLEMWDKVNEAIHRVWENEKRAMTLKEFVAVFPGALYYPIKLRIMTDEKNGDDPQGHLTRYCEQVCSVEAET